MLSLTMDGLRLARSGAESLPQLDQGFGDEPRRDTSPVVIPARQQEFVPRVGSVHKWLDRDPENDFLGG